MMAVMLLFCLIMHIDLLAMNGMHNLLRISLLFIVIVWLAIIINSDIEILVFDKLHILELLKLISILARLYSAS